MFTEKGTWVLKLSPTSQVLESLVEGSCLLSHLLFMPQHFAPMTALKMILPMSSVFSTYQLSHLKGSFTSSYHLILLPHDTLPSSWTTLCWLLCATLSCFPPHALAAFSLLFSFPLSLPFPLKCWCYLSFYYQPSLLSNFTHTQGLNYRWLPNLYLWSSNSIYSRVYWTSTLNSIYSERKLTSTADTTWKQKSSSLLNLNPFLVLYPYHGAWHHHQSSCPSQK